MPAHAAPTLTPHAKAIIAAVVAVAVTGITAWQSADVGRFRWLDLVPVAVAVVGAIQTHLIPNVPELPWAKAVVSAAAAVLAAVATLVAADPGGVTVAKLATVAAGAFLVWFVPEAGPDVAELATDLTGEPFTVDTGGQHEADGGHPATGLTAPAAAPVVARDMSETQPFPAIPPQPPAPAPAAPLPIEAEAQAADATAPKEAP